MTASVQPKVLRQARESLNPKQFRPFCKDCGWRKGGIDSWNGAACKCGHNEPVIDMKEPKS